MSSSQVLSPEAAVAAWKLSLPDEVVDIFNAKLLEKFDGKNAQVLEEALLKSLKDKGFASNRVCEQGWLEQVQGMYQESGWKVEYRSPNWEESFKSYFFFEHK